MRNLTAILLGSSILAGIAYSPADEGAAGGAQGAQPEAIPNAGAVVAFTAQVPTLRQFDAANPAEFGNSYLESLIKVTTFDEELEAATKASDDAKRYVHFELTKAVLAAAEQVEDINIYAIFDNSKAVEKLNSKMLQYLGIIKREIKDDDIVTTWTSKAMEEAYDYGAVDKEKDANEYNKRFNNRKRLNMRFSEAFKAASALKDLGTKAEQLQLVENADTKVIEPVIKNAPAALRGDTEKNGATVKFGQRTAQEGASVAANVAALVKAATETHRKKDPEATGTGERSDKGNDRSGDAKLGMSDEDFGAIVNNLRRAIMAQEANLSPEMVKQLTALVPYIDEQVKLTLNKPKTENLDEISDEPRGEAVDDENESEADGTDTNDVVTAAAGTEPIAQDSNQGTANKPGRGKK